MDTYKILMFLIYLAALIFFWIGSSDFIRISCITNNPDAILKEKKRRIPRITLALIICTYLHLSAVALRLSLFSNSLRTGFHLLNFILRLILIGYLTILNTVTLETLCDIGMTEQVKRSWITLKLTFLPFLLLNVWLVAHSLDYVDVVDGWAVFWFIMLLPLFLLIISLPLFLLPLAINAMHGCIGIKYIRHLRKQTGNELQPPKIHFVLQLVPGLDLISTLLILTKYTKSMPGIIASETDSVTVQSPYMAQSPYATQSLNAAQPPYTAPSPYAYKSAPAAIPAIFTKIGKFRKIFFMLYLLCGMLLYLRIEFPEVYEKITAEKTTFYEMTEEEIALMQVFGRDNEIKEKIAAGQLTANQAELLENLRIGSSYMENKYPDGQFQIERMYHRYNDSYYIHDNYTTNLPEISYYTFAIIPVQSTEQKYHIEFSTSPDSVIEDNLYAYFQKDSYFQYIEEQLAMEIPGFAKCDTGNEWYNWYTAEYEDPANLTVEAILSGEYYAGPKFVNIYISANGKSSAECEQQKEPLSEILHRLGLPVKRYSVFYYDLTVTGAISGRYETRRSLSRLRCLLRRFSLTFNANEYPLQRLILQTA